MKIIMQQQALKWNHTYQLQFENNEMFSTVKRRMAFEKRKISITNLNEETLANINELSSLTPILEKIPVLNLFMTIPYSVEMGGQTIGEIQVKNRFIQAMFTAKINGLSYSCYRHLAGKNGELYSIYNDSNQIGMVRKSFKLEWNAHLYEAEFDDGTEFLIGSIFLVLIDVLWNTSDVKIDENLYQTSFEVSFGVDMKFGKKPDLSWKPKEM